MKKIEDVKERIESTQELFRDEKKALEETYLGNKKKLLRDKKKAGKEITWLTFCMHYLEFHPSESFMQLELNNVLRRIASLRNDCPFDGDNKAKTTKWLNSHGMKTLQLQKRTLSYLLS